MFGDLQNGKMRRFDEHKESSIKIRKYQIRKCACLQKENKCPTCHCLGIELCRVIPVANVQLSVTMVFGLLLLESYPTCVANSENQSYSFLALVTFTRLRCKHIDYKFRSQLVSFWIRRGLRQSRLGVGQRVLESESQVNLAVLFTRSYKS